jgi:Phosphopantetheine attachment site
VLGVPPEQIGRRDHFFNRGGTSLAAVELAIALDRAVTHRDVTRHPILADLARLIDGRSERLEESVHLIGSAGERSCA